MANLNLTVRYLRHGTDPGLPCIESEIRHAEREWSIPAEHSALVLIDCWAEHFIQSHQESSGRIIREVLRPTVDAAREAGIAIIHAPSPTYIQAYPQWVAYASDWDLGLEPGPPPDEWPPVAFRRREGEYSQFVRLPEPKVREWITDTSRYRIHDALSPQSGDWVIKTGDHLHRLLKHRGIMHLFFAGFATNMCVLYRDYGTRAMAQRGYNVLLLRDCTTGIENAETVADQSLTRAAIHSIEVSTGHSTTSENLRQACAAIVRGDKEEMAMNEHE